MGEGGNSGIFYLGQEIEDWPIWKTAPEMQILDNERHPDAMLGKDGKMCIRDRPSAIHFAANEPYSVARIRSVGEMCIRDRFFHALKSPSIIFFLAVLTSQR